MGASGWDERQPWAGDLTATLAAAQQRILDSGDHLWPWDHVDPDDLDDEDEVFGRPGDLAALATAKGSETFWEEGTHTLLDLDRVDATDGTGVVRPLTDAELHELLGTTRPTSSDVARLLGQHGPGDAMLGLLGPTWSGRCLVVHEGSRPTEVLFWGTSGD